MTAPAMTTTRCECGVPAGSLLSRCAACPISALATLTAPTGGGGWPAGRYVPQQSKPTVYVRSRWRKGPTTFGPIGRVLATLLLLLPVPVLLLTMAIGIGIAGMVAYCGFLLPLAMREVWKVAKLPKT